jgi:hypothetical protein
MRVVVVYKEQNDYTREVLDYLRDFKHQTGHDLELVNPDTEEGTQFCETYDIVEYPSVIAISDDGIMQNSWSGLPFPTISEVSYYIQ